MTEASFTTFVKNQLRGATWKWRPVSEVLKEARVKKGTYFCNGCKQEVPASVFVDGKRVKNIFIDHEPPVIDPAVGFTTWDDFVNNLYCEKDCLQLLCRNCHDIKSTEEREVAKQFRKNKKELYEKDI